jgi:hypothetical protein
MTGIAALGLALVESRAIILDGGEISNLRPPGYVLQSYFVYVLAGLPG